MGGSAGDGCKGGGGGGAGWGRPPGSESSPLSRCAGGGQAGGLGVLHGAGGTAGSFGLLLELAPAEGPQQKSPPSPHQKNTYVYVHI